jgi:hypothetical protein
MNLILLKPQSFHSYHLTLQLSSPDIRECSLRERSSRIHDNGHRNFT